MFDRKILILAALLVFLTAFGSSSIVVNSQDWRDNSLAISYSHFTGENVRMVTSLGEGQLISKSLDKNKTHTVYSSNNPVWGKYSGYLSNNELEVEKKNINWSEDQYEFYEDVSGEVKGFVVVKPNYGVNTISVFPKVVEDDYWLIYHRGDRTESFLAENDKPVLFYGEYLDQPWESIDNNHTIISGGSTGENNKRFVRDQLADQGNQSLVVAGDSYIEKGFLKKGSPILLSRGVDDTVEIIEDNDVSIVEVVGAENVNFGNTLKDRFGDSVSVIAKFGRRFTGLENLQDTYPIKKLPVKNVQRNVTVDEVTVDIRSDGTDKIGIKFKNSGNINTFVNFSAIELDYSDENNRLITETRNVNLRKGSSASIILRENISSVPGQAEISYDYLGKAGLNTQAYSVSEGDVNDGYVILNDIYYSNQDNVLVAEISNSGEKTTWVDVELQDISLMNRSFNVLAIDRNELDPGESSKFIFDVRLSEEEIKKNSNVSAKIYTKGSERKFNKMSLDVKETSITGSFMRSRGPIVILILIVLLSISMVLKKREFISKNVNQLLNSV